MTELSQRNDYPIEPIVNGGELPDLFALPNGRRVQNREAWPACVDAWRDLILEMEYGAMPPPPQAIEVETLAHSAISRWPDTPNLWTYRITCRGGSRDISFCVRILFPSAGGPFPVIVNGDGCWSNPEGIVQCAWAAGEVYRFLGSPDHLAFHLRPGTHSHATEDWEVLLDFIGWKWRGMQPVAPYNTHPYAHVLPSFAWKAPEGVQ